MKRKEILSVIRKHRDKEKARLNKYTKYINEDSRALTIRTLRKNGFEPIKHFPRRYYNPTAGVVIKQWGTICGPKPVLSCPTIKCGDWLIQPLVDLKKSDEACNILHKFNDTSNADCHSGNCGYWKGVPIMFDW